MDIWQFSGNLLLFSHVLAHCVQEKSGNPAYLCIAKNKHFEYAEFKEAFSFGHFSAAKNYTYGAIQTMIYVRITKSTKETRNGVTPFSF
jgi:hypothetical protein